MKKAVIITWFAMQAGLLCAQSPDTLRQERFSIHFQSTVINQFKPAFSVPYSGDNSLHPEQENKTSVTATLFLGLRLWKGGSIYLNPEIAGGSGLSEAMGIADATNGETFRVGDPSPKIYLARLVLSQVFALSRDHEYQQGDFNQLAMHMPARYLAFRIGKLSIADYFDDNSYSHDPRTQFLSWSLMDHGSWDYPANTRGYTPSFVAEYVSPRHELRYAISLEPLTANANEMNWDVLCANSQSLEYTYRFRLGTRAGAVRLLGFLNTANMGNYRQSLEMSPDNPDITATRSNGRTKYGFAVNAEQEITADLGCFMRASWNDGNNETWTFTEIDRSVSAGFSLSGDRWKRENDNLGLAWVGSGISGDHRDYLKAGGKGFILGDGKLSYSWEHLAELYYSAELVPDHIYLSGTYQFLINPGYNHDRMGPVHVFSVRLHARI